MIHQVSNPNYFSWRSPTDNSKHSLISRLLLKVARHAAYDSYCTKYPAVKSHHLKISLKRFRPASSVTSCEALGGPSSLPVQSHDDERTEEEYNSIHLRTRDKACHKKKRGLTHLLKPPKKKGRYHVLSQFLLGELLLNSKTGQHNKRLRHFFCQGIPSMLRSQVWRLLTGNPLNISRDLFGHCLHQSHRELEFWKFRSRFSDNREQAICVMCSLLFSKINPIPEQHELSFVYRGDCICSAVDNHAVFGSREDCSYIKHAKMPVVYPEPSPSSRVYCCDRSVNLQSVRMDISRTFPELQLFQCNAPYHKALHDLLTAYMAYQPTTGYVQGMSFLAAVLLLVTGHLFDAFLILVSIMQRPCHRAYYSIEAEEESVVYFHAFDRILATRLPHLHAHFKNVGWEPNMYLFDWFFTLFSRLFPLEHVLRIWDLFFLDGELALFRAALSILHHYETRLMQSSFDQLAVFLTNSLPEGWTVEELMSEMQSLGIKTKFLTNCLTEARAGLVDPLVTPCAHRPLRIHLFPRHSVSETALKSHLVKPATMYSDSLDIDVGCPTFVTTIPGPVDHAVTRLFSPTTSYSSSLNGYPGTEDSDNCGYPLCPQTSGVPAVNLPHTFVFSDSMEHRGDTKFNTFAGIRARHSSNRVRVNRPASEWSLNLKRTHSRLLSSSLSAINFTQLHSECFEPASDTHFLSSWPLRDFYTFSRIPIRLSVERVP